VCQFFLPGGEERIIRIIDRVSEISASNAKNLFNVILNEFSHRHINFEEILESHFQNNLTDIPQFDSLSDIQKMLVSAYCSREYSFESAALMNPSIVLAPDDENKVILSLRQVGEGHISSIGFRSGDIDKNGQISIEQASQFAILPKTNKSGNAVYHAFPDNTLLSERVLYPVTPDECNGMEDARFVQFADGSYYATFTAYDGHKITIKMIYTDDFQNFEVKNLEGDGVNNKGMALFPDKIKNQYAMISRMDGEHLYYMTSPDIGKWESAMFLDGPVHPWEFLQTGNCGSPLKTDEGWLLITHGVGPMRKYVISAILLDLDQPEKVIGRLRDPLLMAEEEEREGYVPNVVYSCGSMIYQDDLILPYAASDYRSGVVSVKVNDLLDILTKSVK